MMPKAKSHFHQHVRVGKRKEPNRIWKSIWYAVYEAYGYAENLLFSIPMSLILRRF